ncbi:MAG: hypothetical protein QOC60_1491 [Frankiaceae bacterium]|nr:hypothetical protein [Frankiaceae bacterium]
MHEAPTVVERSPRVPAWAMLLPAVTLIGGIAIGAAVTSAGKGTDPAPGATAGVSPTSTSSPSTVEVRVPVECLQLAQEAATSLPPIEDAKAAVQNLDFARIQDYIAKMQVAGPRLQDLAQQCRDKSGNVQLGPAPSAS